tara:strand:+ start:922 stop:1455 length:534 start_codon:yes stop_codon:yes gene_type:complete
MAVIEAIASAYLEATATSVVFTGIPQTYEHLQLRVSARDDGAGSDYSEVTLRFGPVGGSIDTGNNYYSTELRGLASAVGGEASGATHRLRMTFISAPNDSAAQFGGGIIDIIDYRNTSKNTSLLWYGGNAFAPTYPWVAMGSGMWNAMGAVDQISVAGYAHGSLLRGSEFTLYGIQE